MRRNWSIWRDGGQTITYITKSGFADKPTTVLRVKLSTNGTKTHEVGIESLGWRFNPKGPEGWNLIFPLRACAAEDTAGQVSGNVGIAEASVTPLDEMQTAHNQTADPTGTSDLIPTPTVRFVHRSFRHNRP